MKNHILSLSDTVALITAGHTLSIAGPEALLAQLPRGTWIGGTTVYALTEEGGARIDDRLFVTSFPEATAATIRHLQTADLSTLAEGYAPGGASLVLIPAFSSAHSAFAMDGMGYPGLFDQPLMGWVTGVPVEEIGTTAPAAFDGTTGLRHADGALLMHLSLPAGSTTSLDIVNIFTQSNDPATTFCFPATGFTATDVAVGTQTVNLARYITEKGLDTRLPLVANYAGALINVSIRAVDVEKGEVSFFAPVVEGAVYHLANPLPDYAAAFAAHIGNGGAAAHSCNCILNYLYGDMAGQKTGNFIGPVTFGEIAYILLNQTLVKLEIA
jgi:hypothetical protein